MFILKMRFHRFSWRQAQCKIFRSFCFYCQASTPDDELHKHGGATSAFISAMYTRHNSVRISVLAFLPVLQNALNSYYSSSVILSVMQPKKSLQFHSCNGYILAALKILRGLTTNNHLPSTSFLVAREDPQLPRVTTAPMQ